jgi:superkiller protein 3
LRFYFYKKTFSASWSALGDAHLHTNNLKTAVNCYSKATSLERETLYSLTRQAFAMTLLGRYNEAISLFDKVLDQSPKYILARKGFIIVYTFSFD